MKYTAPSSIVLLEALSIICPGSSKTTLRSWIKEGRVRIDEELALTANTMVSEGQTVTVGNRKRFLPGNIAILYEDADLVVIDKPSGLLSVASTFDKIETAHAVLKNHYPNKKVQVVHRIDQDTSGVMMFALSQAAYDQLKKDFEVHAIERAYTAIVEGKMPTSKGTWKSMLYEDANYVVHVTDDPTIGKEAITHYTVKNHNRYYSWLELHLETGRKNQIRVHCQDAGHSIVGDKKYGATTNPIKRLCLHAHLLGFTHPVKHKKLSFTSLPPREFYRVVTPEKSS